MKMWAKFSLILVLGGSFLATYAITLLPSSIVPDAELESRQVGVEPLPLSVYCPGAFVEVGDSTEV